MRLLLLPLRTMLAMLLHQPLLMLRLQVATPLHQGMRLLTLKWEAFRKHPRVDMLQQALFHLHQLQLILAILRLLLQLLLDTLIRHQLRQHQRQHLEDKRITTQTQANIINTEQLLTF